MSRYSILIKQSLAFFLFFQITTSSLSSLDDLTEKRIVKLVESNPNQLSIREYSLIANILEEKGSCNMLVFGVGRDSTLWMELNKGGVTVFLEDDPKWLNLIKNQLTNIHAYLVKYNTKRIEWKTLLLSKNWHLLELDNLPDDVLTSTWDVILVDGPTGFDDNTPGRMKSIYTAALLAQRSSNCSVFVHDCDREVEAVYCDTFLQNGNFLWEVDRLRHYIFK